MGRCYLDEVFRRRLKYLIMAIVSYGCGGDQSGKITAIGSPAANLTAPSTTGASGLPACGSTTTTSAVGAWHAMSLQGAPPTTFMAGVWTGSELAVIEPDPSQGSPLSVNAYDPALDRWRNIPVPTNVAFTARMAPYLGAVAGKLIVYGGDADPGTGAPGHLTDGWVIDLNDLTWTAMAPGPELWPAMDKFPRVFADGQRALFVPSGDYIQANNTDVAVATYDLSTQTWATAPAPGSANGFGCVDGPGWNGHQAICADVDYLFEIGSTLPSVEPFPFLDQSLVKPSTEVMFAPVGDMFLGIQPGVQVFWVDPASLTWSPSAEIPSLGTAAATVNGQVLVWGMGALTTTAAGTPAESLMAATFDPVGGVWSPVTCAGAPTWPIIGVTVATPSGLIVFDGSGSPGAAAVLEL